MNGTAAFGPRAIHSISAREFCEFGRGRANVAWSSVRVVGLGAGRFYLRARLRRGKAIRVMTRQFGLYAAAA